MFLFRSRLKEGNGMRAWRAIQGDEVYVPLILHRLCAGLPSPADDHIEEATWDGEGPGGVMASSARC